jgi:RNA polymerase sigma-70 factor (family 1)
MLTVHGDTYQKFEVLYNAQHGALYAYLLNRTRDPMLTEEVVQRTFVRWWELESRGKTGTMDPSKALYVIAKGILIDEHRKTLAAQRIATGYLAQVPATVDNENRLAVDDLQRIIRTAIDKLPPKRKRIFELSRFEDLSYREIADELGISVNTVESQMVKAIRDLRSQLYPYMGDSLNPAHLFILGYLLDRY